MPKSFSFSHGKTISSGEIRYIRISLNWRNELNKEITLVYPYFSVWLKNLNVTLVSMNDEIRNKGQSRDWKESITFKLRANLGDSGSVNCPWVSEDGCEPSLITVTLFFLPSFVLFGFFIIFRDDTSLFLFNLVFKNLILHTFLIIMISIICPEIFRNVPG